MPHSTMPIPARSRELRRRLRLNAFACPALTAPVHAAVEEVQQALQVRPTDGNVWRFAPAPP